MVFPLELEKNVRFNCYKRISKCFSACSTNAEKCHNLFFFLTGTAEGEGLVGPRPHHFFASPPPLFALKRKIITIKKTLETSFSVYIPLYSLYFL